jgi:hypothetical protein
MLVKRQEERNFACQQSTGKRLLRARTGVNHPPLALAALRVVK